MLLLVLQSIAIYALSRILWKALERWFNPSVLDNLRGPAPSSFLTGMSAPPVAWARVDILQAVWSSFMTKTRDGHFIEIFLQNACHFFLVLDWSCLSSYSWRRYEDKGLIWGAYNLVLHEVSSLSVHISQEDQIYTFDPKAMHHIFVKALHFANSIPIITDCL